MGDRLLTYIRCLASLFHISLDFNRPQHVLQRPDPSMECYVLAFRIFPITFLDMKAIPWSVFNLTPLNRWRRSADPISALLGRLSVSFVYRQPSSHLMHATDQEEASIPVSLPFYRVRKTRCMNTTVRRLALRILSGFVFLSCSRHDVCGGY